MNVAAWVGGQFSRLRSKTIVRLTPDKSISKRLDARVDQNERAEDPNELLRVDEEAGDSQRHREVRKEVHCGKPVIVHERSHAEGTA